MSKRTIRLQCTTGTLLASVLDDGQQIEVVSLGPCPCCRKADLQDIPSEVWQLPATFQKADRCLQEGRTVGSTDA